MVFLMLLLLLLQPCEYYEGGKQNYKPEQKCRGHGVPIGLLDVYNYSGDRHKHVYHHYVFHIVHNGCTLWLEHLCVACCYLDLLSKARHSLLQRCIYNLYDKGMAFLLYPSLMISSSIIASSRGARYSFFLAGSCCCCACCCISLRVSGSATHMQAVHEPTHQ